MQAIHDGLAPYRHEFIAEYFSVRKVFSTRILWRRGVRDATCLTPAVGNSILEPVFPQRLLLEVATLQQIAVGVRQAAPNRLTVFWFQPESVVVAKRATILFRSTQISQLPIRLVRSSAMLFLVIGGRSKMHFRFSTCVAGLMLCIGSSGSFSEAVGVEFGPTIHWQKQFGTSAHDDATCIAVDGIGGVYVAGVTAGNLGGTSAGQQDVFLRKYDRSGQVLWTRQFGSSMLDYVNGIAADRLGNVFVCGSAGAALAPNFHGSQGVEDGYVAKFNANGYLDWIVHIGTPTTDSCRRIVADGAGNAFVVGTTYGSLFRTIVRSNEPFVCNVNQSGEVVWGRQFLPSSSSASGTGIAIGSQGSVYTTGQVAAPLGQVFVQEFSASGQEQLTKTITTDRDLWGDAIAVSGENIYLAGINDLWSTSGGWLIKVDSQGERVWERYITTVQTSTYANDVAVDVFGNPIIVGSTYGSMAGPNNGGHDVFIRSYSPSGNILFTKQYGGSGFDSARGLAVDTDGAIYMCGASSSSVFGSSLGGNDAFVVMSWLGVQVEFSGSILCESFLGPALSEEMSCLTWPRP